MSVDDFTLNIWTGSPIGLGRAYDALYQNNQDIDVSYDCLAIDGLYCKLYAWISENIDPEDFDGNLYLSDCNEFDLSDPDDCQELVDTLMRWGGSDDWLVKAVQLTVSVNGEEKVYGEELKFPKAADLRELNKLVEELQDKRRSML